MGRTAWGRARRGDDALARRRGSGRQQAGQGRVDRADVGRTVWGRARRGDDALAPRRGSGRQQAGRVRVDRADAGRKVWGEHGAGMMRLLLDDGADANKQDEDGWTALMRARSHESDGGEHADASDDALARRRGR